jgi:hypothetical protein
VIPHAHSLCVLHSTGKVHRYHVCDLLFLPTQTLMPEQLILRPQAFTPASAFQSGQLIVTVTREGGVQETRIVNLPTDLSVVFNARGLQRIRVQASGLSFPVPPGQVLVQEEAFQPPSPDFPTCSVWP